MKKHGIGSRLISLLLVLAMVVSFVPASVFAAEIGDMATGSVAGDTGLQENIDTQDTISWPVKIYDFLNDGMLFEYANASVTNVIEDTKGGAYGGGTPAPHFTGASTVIGTDYTVDWGYGETPYKTWLPTYSPFESTGSLVEAVNFVSPSHLRLTPDKDDYGDVAPLIISDFYADNTTSGYDPDAVRYAVIAYRTSGLESGENWINLGWNTNRTGSNTKYGHTYDYRGSVQVVANSSTWNYVVVDMKAGTLDSNWDSISAVYRVYIDFGMNETSDSFDISHVAYFSTYSAADQFGKDCVAFDNDPGEFLDAHTEYTDSQQVAYTRPSTGDYNGMDFSVADNTTGGYKVDTYDTWTATPTYYQFLGNSVGGVAVTEVDSGERSYVSISNSKNTTDRSIFLWQYSGGGKLYYVTLVYKTTGFTADQKIGFYVRASGGGGSNMATTLSGATKSATLARSEGEWTTVTYAISDFNDGDYNSSTAYTQYGMYLPSCLTGSSNAGKSLDIAMVWLSTDYDKAVAYGDQGAKYMNGETYTVSGSYTTSNKEWNGGNNVAFSMLFANQGTPWGSYRGGESEQENGYFSYEIGELPSTHSSATVLNGDRETAKEKGYPVSDTTFQIGTAYTTPYDMQNLDFGYKLFNTFESGIMTAGLLESSLITVTANDGTAYRVPDYKESTIEYIAYLLRDALCIGETDSKGYYNYNFVQGTANGEQYGYADDGTPYDLASALRAQLGIVLPDNGNCSYTASGSTVKEVGDYAEMTDEDKAGLIGSFAVCKENINTFVDAAYYLLMNLYVADSYNQAQDEYNYLVLSSATLDNGQTGFVFDGGFTTGDVSDTANTDEYRSSSQSATVYDKERGIIYQSSSASKDKLYFGSDSTTTRFPFLPVTDAEGVYAGETKSPYFLDDGYGVMGVTEEGATFVNRNYNFALAANGEFIYHAEDDLYFSFEGDDDVYLFVNGELVLDIGGAHSITSVSMQVNDYVDWAKTVLAEEAADPTSHTDAEVARAEKLNLVDGESYTFDFYYMERHGWGSNCRIASNIRVTDPKLKTDKTAYQAGEEVPYGGAVNGDQLVEYSFSMTNEGNNKLYNLDFKDGNIGVTLDHNLGLVTHGQVTVKEITLESAGDVVISGFNGAVNMDGTGAKYTENNTVTLEDVAAGTHSLYIYQMNSEPYQDATATITYGSSSETVTVAGVRVTNANGEALDYTDLIITVDGYKAEDMTEANKLNTITVKVSSKEQLTEFLKNLTDPNGETDSSTATTGLFGGAGLWRHATVTIRGMYYRLTNEQKEAGLFDNVVYTYATPSPTSTAVIKGADIHRVYVTGAPTYYQWAGHDLFITETQLKTDTVKASGTAGNQLTEYATFFDKIASGSAYETAFCDKYGTVCTYSEVVKGTDASGNSGYVVNYPEAGSYAFYLLMYLKDTDISDLTKEEVKGKYALVRVTVYVADVEDSVYVLDYGLTTEDLGTDGELFKSDKLFGADGSKDATLMGISDTAPSYQSYKSSTLYNLINFSALGESERIRIQESDGYFTTNLVIPKEITYNSNTNTYSLTEVGTNTITVKTPAAWNNAYLYYWYDGGADNTWPGTAMEKVVAGEFTLDIPGDVANVIISNVYDQTDDGIVQTENLLITPNLATTISVDGSLNSNNKLTSTMETAVENVTIYADVPDTWENVYLYYWYDENNNIGWPGTVMTKDSDGLYSLSIPGNVSNVIINNGDGNKHQTNNLLITAGEDNKIVVDETGTVGDDGITRYGAEVTPMDERECVIHVQVPDGWGSVYLHYWSGSRYPVEWPGTAMTDTDNDGWYDLKIPADMTYAIVNNGKDQGKQTVDLAMRPDLETWITVTSETTGEGKYKADVDYRAAITFTPTDFMDELYEIYMAVTVHDVNVTPTALTDAEIDITKEVQMYKTIAVLPASVVYYEDDFPAIHYATETDTEGVVKLANNITPIGSSSDLAQSVDQDQNYGQDEAYSNTTEYSGNSQHEIVIKDGQIAYFDFKGTGFELIASTQAVDYATIVVTVKDSDGNEIERVPVILQYDNGENGGAEEIYQVPVIRVDCPEYATYRVEITGIPSYDYSEKVGNSYKPKTTILYLDGLRIYEPLGDSDASTTGKDDIYYNDNEKNVTFAELRDLIVEGKVATASYNGSSVTVSTGTVTWTENLNGEYYDRSAFTGNQVSSVEDYLVKGPNNEVYLDGDTTDSALVFYVKKDSSGNSNLQIAVHAVDSALFYGSGSSGMNAVVQYGIKQANGDYVWTPLATVTSGTEQYYTIDLTDCPVDSAGRIQVAVGVSSGMASFTSLKYNGLELVSMSQETTELKYVNGMLYVVEEDDSGNTIETLADGSEYPEFQTLSLLMRSSTLSVEPDVPDTTPELFDISYASMTMGNSLAINFAFEQGHVEDWTDYYVEIVKSYADDRDDVVQTVPFADWKTATINNIAHYYVTFNGIAAKEMTDDVYVTVYNADGEPVSNVWTDSVRAQAMRNLAKDTISDEEKTMVVDMLNYGAAAQEYFTYDTEDLATAQLTEEQKACATTETSYTDTHTGNENYYATNIVLKSNIKLMFAFKNVDTSMKAVVTFTNHYGVEKEITVDGSEFEQNGSYYVVTVDELVVADGRQDVTCTVYDGETVVATVTDSVESYAARMSGDGVLFEMLMKFSDSAYAYFHK